MIIKSIGYDQQEIINNILTLHNHGRSIEFDPCYNVGAFYRNGVVCGPETKSDINPLLSGVQKLDVRNLPFASGRFNSIIFDPPFIVTGGKDGRMSNLYGSFGSVAALEQFYRESLISLQRVLRARGILIVKTQDFVNGRKQHIFLNYVLNLAGELSFVVKDLFVLLAKSRPISKTFKQQHARKFHSYFLVLKKSRRASAGDFAGPRKKEVA